MIWNKLKVILAEHSVLFIGYSLEDKNIEDIFEKVLSQVDTSKSEFFIAVPTLAEHKLRHFNTICKTTHLPIDGETLLSLIEKSIRENIVLDKYAIEKVLSVFEPVEVEDTIWNLNLQINCDRQLYESLKIPSNHPMKMIEGIEENIYLFGHEYFIKEQQITILCPVIENTDEVKNMLLSGNKAIAKIVSSTGKFILQCKM